MFKQFVVKFPTFISWKLFLYGMIANIDEHAFSKMKGEKGLPTVYYGNRFGLVLIAKRVRPIKHRGLFWVDLVQREVTSNMHRSFWTRDAKPENYGYDEHMVLTKIDLG